MWRGYPEYEPTEAGQEEALTAVALFLVILTSYLDLLKARQQTKPEVVEFIRDIYLTAELQGFSHTAITQRYAQLKVQQHISSAEALRLSKDLLGGPFNNKPREPETMEAAKLSLLQAIIHFTGPHYGEGRRELPRSTRDLLVDLALGHSDQPVITLNLISRFIKSRGIAEERTQIVSRLSYLGVPVPELVRILDKLELPKTNATSL